jgi:hypothetical protein
MLVSMFAVTHNVRLFMDVFGFHNNEKRRITKINFNLMYPSPCVLLIIQMHSVFCNTTPLYFLIKDIQNIIFEGTKCMYIKCISVGDF